MILAVAWYEKVCVFNVVTRYPLYTFLTKGYRHTKVITFSKNGQRIFSSDGGTNIYGHDIYSGTQDFQCQLPEVATSLVLCKNTLLVT